MKVHMRGINKDYLYFIEELPINPAEGLPSKNHIIVFESHNYMVVDVVWFLDKRTVILEVTEV